MKHYAYDINIPANSEQEADEKMKALISIVNKLSADELRKIQQVINNPIQLAVIKSKLL